MKPLAAISNLRRFALLQILIILLFGCDGQKLILTERIRVNVENTTENSATNNIGDSAPEATVVVASPESIAANDDTASNTLHDVSRDDVAAAFIANQTALGPVKIMAVGDSITHGVAGVSSYRREFTALMQSETCSFTMVGSQLTSGSSATDQGIYNGAHEGYGGHRADHFLTGLVSSSGNNQGIQISMESYTPDVVLLHLGSNDIANQQGVSNALMDLENVLNTIYEVKPETLVLIANVIPWFSDYPYPNVTRDMERLGDGVEQMVNERHDPFLQLVDVRSGFTELMMLDDLIHPNVRGENHIADAFMNIYQSITDCSSL